MRFSIVFTIIFAIHRAYSQKCYTVEAGHHYPSLIPFHSLKENLTISTRVQFNNNTARYLFPPTESKGHRCSVSWNKLWGATRCGYLTNVHQDSDRFMWRRAVSCLIFDSDGHVIGEKSNCSEANLIEVVAGAYDGGLRPYDHEGTLLKQFTTKLQVDRWYGLTMIFNQTQTIYQLSNHADVHLETRRINHRVCPKFNQGMMETFYFGGECTAPQAVSTCYDEPSRMRSIHFNTVLKNDRNISEDQSLLPVLAKKQIEAFMNCKKYYRNN